MASGLETDDDHYAILGLPSGEEGTKLSIKEIEKAYKVKARECHPDKRRNDPNATAVFQKLVSSFEILKDEAARKAFDDLLRARRERVLRESRHDAKRRKMATDLEERERTGVAGPGVDPVERARREEVQAAARLKEELARFRAAMLAKKTAPAPPPAGKDKVKSEGGFDLDKERVLKVSWEKSSGEYSEAKLREVFSSFGEVEDVMLRSKGTRKKGSALVIMATKAAAVRLSFLFFISFFCWMMNCSHLFRFLLFTVWLGIFQTLCSFSLFNLRQTVYLKDLQ